MRAMLLATASLLAAIGFRPADESHDAVNFSENPRDSTVQEYARWMSCVSNNTLLSRVSLPGTHDSCALHNGASFGFAKCQSWKLADQLKAGIRFIDIRCRHINDQLLIYHGIIDQKITFREVLETCRDFLRDHPSECIVMSVKEESTATGNTRRFDESFAVEANGHGKLLHISPVVPKLNSVRGRIVLVDRVGKLGGIPWKVMLKQDHYKASLDTKANLIRGHFTKAARSTDQSWYINFCSGTVPKSFITPRQYALATNRVALSFLQQQSVANRPIYVGTVMLDFPGEELIERIVHTNFARSE